MSRYLVFCALTYYPRGGMNDLEGSFDDFVEAFDVAINRSTKNSECYDPDFSHIFDTHTGKIVLEARWSGWEDRVPALTYHDLDEETKTMLALRCRDKYRREDAS